MAIPTLSGFAEGEKMQATKLNRHTKTAIEESVYFKPYCKLQRSVTYSHPHGTGSTLFPLDFVVEDTDSMADLPNNQITIVTPGLYRVTGQMTWASNNTGWRHMYVQTSAGIVASDTRHPAQGTQTRMRCGGEIRLAAGATVILAVAQNTGSALAVDLVNPGCWLSAEWISL